VIREVEVAELGSVTAKKFEGLVDVRADQSTPAGAAESVSAASWGRIAIVYDSVR